MAKRNESLGEAFIDDAKTSPQTPESRHFNQWLDRALPLLQQQLASLGIIHVTAREDKPKH